MLNLFVFLLTACVCPASLIVFKFKAKDTDSCGFGIVLARFMLMFEIDSLAVMLRL